MQCPYQDCQAKLSAQIGIKCEECGRLLKQCPSCRTVCRSFASYCRACGKALPSAGWDWPQHRGGAERIGATAYQLPSLGSEAHHYPGIELGGKIRFLLTHDGYAFAFDFDGGVWVINLEAAPPRLEWNFYLGTRPFSWPVLHRGSLYVALQGGRLAAFSLGLLHSAKQDVDLSPRWERNVDGTVAGSLALMDGALLATTRGSDRRFRVMALEGAGDHAPGEAVPLLEAGKISSPAATKGEGPRRAYCFAETGSENICLHVIQRQGQGLTANELSRLDWTVGGLDLQRTPSVSGNYIFNLFENMSLIRFNRENGRMTDSVGKSVQNYSLTSPNKITQITMTGLSFPSSQFIPIQPNLLTRRSPLLVRGCCAVISQMDGALNAHDMKNPHRIIPLRPPDQYGNVGEMAAYGDKIIACYNENMIRVIRLPLEN